ncbi:hypothetical protein SAMN05519104_0097 [Rhizobiales bacterium GAS188]|nr:hypothetical protein SAMN05519104_0097 [Rhizobiales bacterium GAS188]
MSAMTARRYLLSLTAFTLAGLALIVLLGLGVDGYGVFGTRLIPASRFPSELRLTGPGDRITKAIEIAQRRGDRILFMGDSRTQHGLDPDSPALGGVKGYNAALAAATLSEQLVMLDFALAHDPSITHIVWGLSFEIFPSPIAATTDYADSGFAGSSLTSGFVHHLFAFDFVASSFQALLQARHQVQAPMKRNGVALYEGDPVEGPGIARYHDLELAAESRELRGPVPASKIEAAHAQLRARLAELKARGIDVDLVIVPVHVWRLEFFRLIGVEAQIADWKREVARSVDQLAAAPGSGRLSLFDFERPHPYVEQPILAPLPPGERRFFLETSHFYPWLGDIVLAKVFGKDPGKEVGEEGTAETPPFGVEIGKMSIEADLASAAAGLDAWEAAHPADVSHVKQLIGKR